MKKNVPLQKKIYMLFIKQSSVEDSPVVIQPNVLKDERGYFMETFKEKEFFENVGNINFIQENESCSTSGVFRGLHFQKPPYFYLLLYNFQMYCLIVFFLNYYF